VPQQKIENTPLTNKDKAFPEISFTDLVRHTLLDQFEFGAHSFEDLRGPYFWNSIGIDFEAPMPKEQVLEHAKSVNADTIYLAHTHPLSTGNSLKFLDEKIDPREKIAFGTAPLPLGNKPSAGDVSFLAGLKKESAFADIKLKGVVFSASGLWEFDILDTSNFNAEMFTEAYDTLYPLGDSTGFMEEWNARDNFPNYYMEIQKPKMHVGSYKLQVKQAKTRSNIPQSNNDEALKVVNFFNDNGVGLTFHPYYKFNVQPQELMRSTLSRWADIFQK
jgi:hypothetical protein